MSLTSHPLLAVNNGHYNNVARKYSQENAGAIYTDQFENLANSSALLWYRYRNLESNKRIG